MVDKIISLLSSQELQLETKRVILANYFPALCKAEEMKSLLLADKLHRQLIADIINNYRRPLYRWDPDIPSFITPILETILLNPNKYGIDIVARSLVTLSEYNKTYVLDKIEVFSEYVVTNMQLYGPTADYLINLISKNSSHLENILVKLKKLMVSNANNIDAAYLPAKLLLDIIYRHYKLHPSYKNNRVITDLLEVIRQTYASTNLGELFEGFIEYVQCEGIVFFDMSDRFEEMTLHYNAGFNAKFSFKKNVIPLGESGIISQAVNNTSPIFLASNGPYKNDLFLKYFEISVNNILVIPCLYFGKINSIIVLINCNVEDDNTILYSIILAKYLAGAINALKPNLEFLRTLDKAHEEHYEVVKCLEHDIHPLLSSISGHLTTMRDKKSIIDESLTSCEDSLTIIEDSIDSISEFSSTKQKARQIGEIVKVTLRALNPKIKKNKIRINLSLDPNCPAILTPPGLFRVFQNVIRNATNELLKKGPENREIRISSHFDEINKIIVVYIADNGMGIALNSETTAQDIASLVKINEVIFKPHFDPSGKGLGLPFSRKILKAMGGDIHVSETSSHGTTFEIILKANEK